MRVTLERTVIDHVEGQRVNVYRREDDRYWVLFTPTDPSLATAANVYERVCNTRDEAFALCDGRSDDAERA